VAAPAAEVVAGIAKLRVGPAGDGGVAAGEHSERYYGGRSVGGGGSGSGVGVLGVVEIQKGEYVAGAVN
jgi:hypothetical protein